MDKQPLRPPHEDIVDDIRRQPDACLIVATFRGAGKPPHRSQRIEYSRLLRKAVQTKTRLAPIMRDGAQVGWAARGEEIVVLDTLPTDLDAVVKLEA